MCFLIDDKYPNFFIAKKDIVVYKLVTKNKRNIKSICENFLYKIGITYTEKRFKYSSRLNDLFYGYHSYSTIFMRYPRYKTGYIGWDISETDVICKFIIPKGAIYFKSKYNGSASDRIAPYTNGYELISNKIICTGETYTFEEINEMCRKKKIKQYEL